MTVDIQGMFEQLAELGTAPRDGCSLFGAGNEIAYTQLREHFVFDRFSRGRSAEKFVVGPFGSGKTHFLRQLMELGREHDCVTTEVQLNKNVDFTQSLVVFQEVARECRAPGKAHRGVAALIQDAVERIRRKSEAEDLPSADILRSWADGLANRDFRSLAFGRVLKKAVHAHLDGDAAGVDLATRWLSGEVTVTVIAKAVGESTMKQSQIKVHAQNARLSLFQFIKHAGYRGTIVGFDEAEQSMDVDKKRMAKIFSHLLSEVNALIDLPDGSALVLHAVTPDVMEKMALEMPMLMQRIADPAPGQGFFDGNPFAVRINLAQREDPALDLARIGQRLLDAYVTHMNALDDEAVAVLRVEVDRIAQEVASEEQSSSARRLMVKRTCTLLMQIRTPKWATQPRVPEPEV